MLKELGHQRNDEEMAEHFEAAATAAKDREELAKKKDFPAATQ